MHQREFIIVPAQFPRSPQNRRSKIIINLRPAVKTARGSSKIIRIEVAQDSSRVVVISAKITITRAPITPSRDCQREPEMARSLELNIIHRTPRGACVLHANALLSKSRKNSRSSFTTPSIPRADLYAAFYTSLLVFQIARLAKILRTKKNKPRAFSNQRRGLGHWNFKSDKSACHRCIYTLYLRTTT